MIYQWICDAPANKKAIVCGGRSITYGELARRIRIWYGVKAGIRRPVTVACYDPFEFIDSMVGLFREGLVVFPTLPSMGVGSAQRVNEAIRSASEEDWREGNLLALTSGSCGASRIVVRSLDNLEDEARAVGEHLGLTPESKMCVMTPLAHSFGCGLWRAAMWAGATLYVPDGITIHGRLEAIRATLGAEMDFVFGVPYLYRVLASKPLDVAGSPRCFAGGETLTETTYLRWLETTGIKLRQEYGLTEGGITTMATEDTPFRSIGVPIPGVRIKIAEPDEADIGELVVYRPHAPVRYLVEGMNDTFQRDGGIRTGDMGTVDPVTGQYYFCGRKKSIIVVAGLKMVPEEVEATIRKHPDVAEAVVIGLPDAMTGERPAAFVTLKGEEGTVGEIREILKTDLDSYKVPKKIVVLERLPRTPSGKVDRNALAKL